MRCHWAGLLAIYLPFATSASKLSKRSLRQDLLHWELCFNHLPPIHYTMAHMSLYVTGWLIMTRALSCVRIFCAWLWPSFWLSCGTRRECRRSHLPAALISLAALGFYQLTKGQCPPQNPQIYPACWLTFCDSPRFRLWKCRRSRPKVFRSASLYRSW